MKTLKFAAAAALLLSVSAPRPAPAQDDEDGKRALPGLSSRYVDCLQPRTIDMLLGTPATQWGISEGLALTAHDRLYGIQLCRGYAEDTDHYCRQLAKSPGSEDWRKMTKELGRDCATDMEFFRAHAALRSADRSSVGSRCRRWCELEAGKSREKVDCAGFCEQIIPLMPDKGAEACKLWVDRLTRQKAASPEELREELPECRMMLSPSPSTCVETYGAAVKRACLDRHAVLEALRLKDPKRCPKSLRYGAVCAALTTPEGKPPDAACAAAARSFTQLLCDEHRASGGLRDETKLPGDSETTGGW